MRAIHTPIIDADRVAWDPRRGVYILRAEPLPRRVRLRLADWLAALLVPFGAAGGALLMFALGIGR